MSNFAIIDSGGTVINIVVADSIEDVFPPAGSTALPVDVGAEVGGTYNGTNFVPISRPPPPPPTATGAQMIDEAKTRNKLGTLLTVLTASERAVFFTRRKIVAGSPFAEILRGKLGMTSLVMKNFIAAAAVRREN